MHISSLYLRNFRNFEEAELRFSPGINLFYGDNAQGKTNLLEAIALIATGRSFRTTRLKELIREGALFFFLEAKVSKEGFEHTIQISSDGRAKQLVLDGNSYATLQHLLGLVPSVFYTPSDGELIDGSPAIRRRFFNLHLAQKDPLYLHHLSRYWRAMQQRNAILREPAQEGIECWEQEMDVSATYLWQTRTSFLSELKAPLQTNGQFLSSGRENYELRAQFGASHNYLAQLIKNRPREKHLGLTLNGPHRDDFNVWIEGKSADAFASEGQKKTAAFALRLAEWELFAKSGVQALFCLDDLGVHLDEGRRSLFSRTLAHRSQVFVTAPEIRGEPLSCGQCFLIKAGSARDREV